LGHFRLKSGHISVPQRLAGLKMLGTVYNNYCVVFTDVIRTTEQQRRWTEKLARDCKQAKIAILNTFIRLKRNVKRHCNTSKKFWGRTKGTNVT